TALIDLALFALQTVDGVGLARPFGLSQGGLEVLAALADPVVLDVEEQARDLAGLRRRLLQRHHRLGERSDLVVGETGDESGRIEWRMDPVVVRRPGDDERTEQLAGERARQLVGPELLGDAD